MAIHDDVQHANFVELIDRLMKIEKLTAGQGDYLETLVELVEAFESKRHVMESSKVDGIQMLQHVMSESGTSRFELAKMLGVHPSMGSKILKGDRRLTWEHAKKLGEAFKVEPALFMD